MSGFFWVVLIGGVALTIMGAWPFGLGVILFALLVGFPEREIERNAADLFDDDGIIPGASHEDAKRNADNHGLLFFTALFLFAALMGLLLLGGL